MKRLAIVAAASVLVLSTTMAPAGVIHRRQKHQQARRFQDAIREYEAALRIAPNNATVQNLLNRAKQGKN